MEKYDIHPEFAAYEQKIDELKSNDVDFRSMYDEFHKIDDEIHQIESTGIFTDDELNKLRFERVQMKRQIFEILQTQKECIG